MPPYNPQFPRGTSVRIADRETLEEFRRTWKYHNKLREEKLAYGNQTAVIENIGAYHGGDILYTLLGIPGVWHETCLREASGDPGA
jgi:hypothetical protein